MHNFGNIEDNLERLAYKYVLDDSEQNYGHFFWMCEKHNMENFSIFGRGLLRINSSFLKKTIRLFMGKTQFRFCANV